MYSRVYESESVNTFVKTQTVIEKLKTTLNNGIWLYIDLKYNHSQLLNFSRYTNTKYFMYFFCKFKSLLNAL